MDSVDLVYNLGRPQTRRLRKRSRQRVLTLHQQGSTSCSLQNDLPKNILQPGFSSIFTTIECWFSCADGSARDRSRRCGHIRNTGGQAELFMSFSDRKVHFSMSPSTYRSCRLESLYMRGPIPKPPSSNEKRHNGNQTQLKDQSLGC